jgi:hypothetical protein
LGDGCSNVTAESNALKRPRGRPVKVEHFHDDVDPSHFAKVVMYVCCLTENCEGVRQQPPANILPK